MVGPATLNVHGLVSAQRSWRIVAERQPGPPGSSAASGEPCQCSRQPRAQSDKVESSMKETAPPHIAREPPAPPPLPAPAWLSPSSDFRVPSPEDAILFRSGTINQDYKWVFLRVSSSVPDPATTSEHFFASLGCRLPSRGPFRGAAPGRGNMVNRSQIFHLSIPTGAASQEKVPATASKGTAEARSKYHNSTSTRPGIPSHESRRHGSGGWDADAGFWIIHKSP